MRRPRGDVIGRGQADHEAQKRRRTCLPDRPPEDQDIGPFDLARLVPEKAPTAKELVIGAKAEFPDHAAAEFLGQEGIDQHHADRGQYEDAQHKPRGQQKPVARAGVSIGCCAAAACHAAGHQSTRRRGAPCSMLMNTSWPGSKIPFCPRSEFDVRTVNRSPPSRSTTVEISVPIKMFSRTVPFRLWPSVAMSDRKRRSGRIDICTFAPAPIPSTASQLSACPPPRWQVARPASTVSTDTSSRFVSPMKSATNMLRGRS